MTDLFFSFGNQHPGQLVLNNYPAVHAGAEHPGQPGVRHGRDRHPAGSRARRAPLQRVPPPARPQPDPHASTTSPTTRTPSRRSREVYGDNVENLDLLIGTLAETQRPTNFGFGETMFQIFILNASRRLQADRFYTDDYRPEVYTEEGMQWVDDASLKTVILRHFPELGRHRPRQRDERLRAMGHRHLARSAPAPAPRLPAGAEARPLARRRPPRRAERRQVGSGARRSSTMRSTCTSSAV